MKKTTTFLAAFWLCFIVTTLACTAKTYKVLFVGNSYTFYNTLPAIVQGIAQSQGHDIIFESATPGGHTFANHSSNSTTLDKINSDDWDFVVLQEQSQIPSFPPGQVATDSYPFAEMLCNAIRQNNPCTKPLFFMTWGRQNGDASNCDVLPILCTYEGMQGRLTESYTEMAYLNNASVAPVGEAWRTVRTTTEDAINLYSGDGSHPSNLGSYLAACVFYAAIFQESPLGSTYTDGLNEADVALLQEIAGNTVLNDLDTWHISTPTPPALADAPCVVVQANLLLTGAYNSDSNNMSNYLSTNNLLPPHHPFQNAPWNYPLQHKHTNLNSNTVDWVLVEARNSNDVNTVVAQKPALLLSDGTLADVNGFTNGVALQGLNSEEEYYLSIKTRNHLGLLSANALSLPNANAYDFSLVENVRGGDSQLQNVGDSSTPIYAAKVGDINGNGIVNVHDFNAYIVQFGMNTYTNADINFDGLVDDNDWLLYQENATGIGVWEIRY